MVSDDLELTDNDLYQLSRIERENAYEMAKGLSKLLRPTSTDAVRRHLDRIDALEAEMQRRKAARVEVRRQHR